VASSPPPNARLVTSPGAAGGARGGAHEHRRAGERAVRVGGGAHAARGQARLGEHAPPRPDEVAGGELHAERALRALAPHRRGGERAEAQRALARPPGVAGEGAGAQRVARVVQAAEPGDGVAAPVAGDAGARGLEAERAGGGEQAGHGVGGDAGAQQRGVGRVDQGGGGAHGPRHVERDVVGQRLPHELPVRADAHLRAAVAGARGPPHGVGELEPRGVERDEGVAALEEAVAGAEPHVDVGAREAAARGVEGGAGDAGLGAGRARDGAGGEAEAVERGEVGLRARAQDGGAARA
jgi:hypothetical protein